MRIPADTAAFLTSLPGFVATRDAANHPTTCEALLIGLDPETGVGEIAANVRYARNMMANLADNGRVALVSSRIWGDHRSAQIKGRCLEVRGPALVAERIAAQLDVLARVIITLGLPPSLADDYRKIGDDPHYLIRVQVDEVYDQTPGPGAGRPVA